MTDPDDLPALLAILDSADDSWATLPDLGPLHALLDAGELEDLLPGP